MPSFPDVSWPALVPLLLVSGLGIVLLASGLFVEDEEVLGWEALAGLAVTLVVTLLLIPAEHVRTFHGTFALDGYALFFDLLFIGAGMLVVLMSMDYIDETSIKPGEYYALLMFALAGMIVMAAAADLIVVFLGLEIMSMSVYILAGAWRTELRSNEAALKYFLLGAFATGFLLYGIALLYGATATFRLDLIAARASTAPDRGLLLGGVAMLLVAFGFKVAAVPFHMWAPDVYEGAPTSVTALMAVAVKAAAFAAFARVFFYGLAPLHAEWWVLLWGLSVATMTVGNVLALAQRSVKRMLAYSSIAHAGYVLIALTVGGLGAGPAVLFYLLVYAVMTLGAFGVVIAVGQRGAPNENLDDYAGLGYRSPLLGVTMTVFMLSLTGIPPLAGFAGKFYLFTTAVREGYVVLAVIGVLNSVISAGYYVRVLVAMYMTEAVGVPVGLERRPYLATSIVVSAVLTVMIGVFPALWLEIARLGFLSV
jgi:NADH-quinone oxidoreductase subunit N